MVAAEQPAAVPADSDNDGVSDELDKCPATPAAAKVNAIGCPIDSDADGVADYRDQCPNTARGVSIDANGCPSKLSLQINFDLDSDIISPAFDAEISKAAECIADFPGNIVYIDGHTDNLGPALYNQKLSERRAAAVMNRLIEKFNIPASRMTSRGFGESMPVADNSSDVGLTLNRRVEVACGATE
jgi:OOP family OmpA-OmpF porin